MVGDRDDRIVVCQRQHRRRVSRRATGKELKQEASLPALFDIGMPCRWMS
jgi:hypothetical protein